MFIFIILGVFNLQSCIEEADVSPLFQDEILLSIHGYIVENEESYSSFLSIIEKGGIDITLSAYNPQGNGYTLFLPDNDAIDRYIASNAEYSSLDDLLNDKEFTDIFCRYHVINMSVRSNNFPYGAFSQKTLSEDFLTVSFFIEDDSSYYKINNQSTVIFPNIEVSNGYIHYIEEALQPVTYTSYEWVEQHPEYSIFKGAVDLTGLDSFLYVNSDDAELVQEYTLLLESDEIYNKKGILSTSDLVDFISPDRDDYTDHTNPLNQFVGYHILIGGFFIDDFEGKATQYLTAANIPLSIDGEGIDLAINKGKEIFDTIINQMDTTIVDYISVNYDESNLLTQSGSIHFIDQVMTVKSPSRASKNYQFYENSVIDDFKNDPGTYLIASVENLEFMDWTGSDLYYFTTDENINAWGNDYLELEGDFIISYQIEPQIPGEYRVYIRADAYSNDNAVVEVYVDGRKISGLLDFTKGGTNNRPFETKLAGTVSYSELGTHVVQIRSLIPGEFVWDGVRFEPF